jgi:hypothetical protein
MPLRTAEPAAIIATITVELIFNPIFDLKD